MDLEKGIVICPQCGTKNRVPKDRVGEHAVCGKCRAPLPSGPIFPEQVIELTDWNFDPEIIDFSGPVLLEFFAPWCGHCQRLAPILDQLASEYKGRVKVAKLNVELSSQTASQYGIRSTPSLFFFKRGKLVDRVFGALPKGEIERHLQSLL